MLHRSVNRSTELPSVDWFCWITLLGLSGLLVGCGRSGPYTVPVEGTVTLDGNPVAYKSLLFLPDQGTAGNGAGGFTDGKGQFKLIAVVFGATTDFNGCPPGRYRVVVSEPSVPLSEADFASDAEQVDNGEPIAAIAPRRATAKREIPPIYSSEQTTPLVLEVPETGGVVNVELKSRP
ncbi:MAG: hypothetical protein H6821_06180 [Planctomycetaceae bacterium]|nr:hypothetical protein [Planctomycetales bacterium]MCB9873750.1 hypothetical protein [Planctomycetaceae bacterium]MCB9939759.1 hypothetical protein [Planctomycetaceae bacterium]